MSFAGFINEIVLSAEGRYAFAAGFFMAALVFQCFQDIRKLFIA
jgi:hypothetical protein